jgi:hypothetical protein
MLYEVTEHHRRPRSRGGTNDQSNISLVTDTQHRAWHTLFGNLEPEQVVERINNIWLDPSYRISLTKQ